MKSIQVTMEHILKHILIYAKKVESEGVVTIYRPDFSSLHRIPGIKPNWSPDRIEINKTLNTMRVWRIAESTPSISVDHLTPDEQGYSDVKGLSGDELPKIDIPSTKNDSSDTKNGGKTKLIRKQKKQDDKIVSTFD